MRRWLFENSLSLFFLAFFLLSLLGQSLAGVRVYNEEQAAHGGETISWLRYLVSSHFGGNVMENWQSEFLQFTTFIVATVWLVQKGSNESKRLGEAGVETDREQRVGRHAPKDAPRPARQGRGLLRFVYENSLVLAMAAIFLLSWGGQSLNNWRAENEERHEHGEPSLTWSEYVRNADFWERSLENWQSEFLAVGTMAVFTIYLRQRGSPESKPVGAPHDETGSSG
jgi:hypothetical protein